MNKGKIFIISGPSGSGKTTLYKKLLASHKSLAKSVSVTTRKPRSGERNGRDYIFVSQKMYLYKKAAGHFLETEKVFDNFYGTTNKGVQDILKKGKNVLLCVDVEGAKVIKQKFPKAIRVFVKTSSLKTLKNRLQLRGSEDKKTINLRLGRARKELLQAKGYEHIVLNDRIDSAHKRLAVIVDQELKK